MVFIRATLAVVYTPCFAVAFYTHSSLTRSDCKYQLFPPAGSIARVIRSQLPPYRLASPPRYSRRDTRSSLAGFPQYSGFSQLYSRTVDVDVIDVVDVTEEEERKQERQKDLEDITGRIGTGRGRRRPQAEVTKEIRELIEEAGSVLREAGPRAVGGRGVRASRWVASS